MIRNKKLKTAKYNPLTTFLQQQSIDQTHSHFSQTIYSLLNNYSSKVRQNSLIFLANMSGPLSASQTEYLTNKEFTNQVFLRFEQESQEILNALFFAIANIFQLSQRAGKIYLELGLINRFQLLGPKITNPILLNNFLQNLACILQKIQPISIQHYQLQSLISWIYSLLQRKNARFFVLRLLCLITEVSYKNSLHVAKLQQSSEKIRQILIKEQQTSWQVLASDILINLMYRLLQKPNQDCRRILATISNLLINVINNSCPESDYFANFSQQQPNNMQQQLQLDQQVEAQDQNPKQALNIQPQLLRQWKNNTQTVLWALQDLADLLSESADSFIPSLFRQVTTLSLNYQKVQKLALGMLIQNPEVKEIVDQLILAAVSLCIILKIKVDQQGLHKSLKYSFQHLHGTESIEDRFQLLDKNCCPQQIALGSLQISLKLNNKDMILYALQIVSQVINPEKRKINRSSVQKASLLIKQCLWHQDVTINGQALDTLFDVYCNQDFDDLFKKQGLMDILQKGLQLLNGYKQEFLRAVKQDLKRFIIYKKANMSV